VRSETEYRHVQTDYFATIKDLYIRECFPLKLIAPEAAEERTFIAADLDPMVMSFVGTSIMEGVTDESWENFLKDLKSYGYYDYIDWYQNFADGKF